jgi:hypothetical protein
MTPKEKAKELVNKFKDDLFKQRHVTIYTEDAILIALIAVDEIISIVGRYSNYWQEVKQEINQL